MPAVSVIMLTWNNGPWLAAAVQSVLGQTFVDLELILVDDGSTDGSVDHLLSVVDDKRLQVIRHQTNLGICAGFAAALPRCTGRWIAVADADDVSHPMRLRMQLDAAAVDASLDLIATDAITINADGKLTGYFASLHTPDEIRNAAPFIMPVINPTLLVRADLFRRTGYRPEVELAPDYDFFVRALELGGKPGAISLPLYSYRRHANSTTAREPRIREIATCAVRLCAARRRANRAEDVSGAFAAVRTWAASPLSLGAIYRRYAALCAKEGFFVLAAFHAALAQRVEPSLVSQLCFLRHLATAVANERGAWKDALRGFAKGPFWIMLRRAGYPGLPRY